jgi:hypothetical protein
VSEKYRNNEKSVKFEKKPKQKQKQKQKFHEAIKHGPLIPPPPPP